jgi:DmsE family decaheme c-type cytochrome
MKSLKKLLVALALTGGAVFGASAQTAASDAPPAVDRTLKGDAVCTRCHDESEQKPVLAMYKSRHGVKADVRTPGCQSCHGTSDAHLKTKTTPPDVVFGTRSKNASSADAQNASCMNCHQADAKRTHWDGSTHQTKDVRCTSCHEVHTEKDKVRDKLTQPEVCFTCHKEQRAQISKPSRHPILEGKMSCSDCHNPHGSVGPKLMRRDSVVETCYTCHMEKRGPFVHTHEPVADDCSNCHNPHGTVVESMLKVRAPFLCHQCHTPHGGLIPQLKGAQASAPTDAMTGKSTTNLTQGRSCLNCHTQVHGTNNPSTANPTPQFNLR